MDKNHPKTQNASTGGIIVTATIAIVCGALLVTSTGCSTSGMAVRAMAPIIENSKNAALASNDIQTFDAATPANLFLLEGLIETQPKNENLRVTSAMLHFSYAFTRIEDRDPEYASLLYLKGLDHGKTALLRNKKIRKAWDQPFEEFTKCLADIERDDLPALVWTVANWSQFIGLHLDSIQVLTEIPRVIALLERACEIDGNYFEGLPYIMLGTIHAFRPPLMGGDPEASKANFDRAVTASKGKFLLAYYFYAKFYYYRVQDAEGFEQTLQHVIAQSETILPKYRLLNSIARQKSRRLLDEKDDLF
jgi:hypothetical protein